MFQTKVVKKMTTHNLCS